MDPENLQGPSDKNETPLKDYEDINLHNETPQHSGVVERTEIDSIPLPSKQPTKKFQDNQFFLPTLNFDSDTSDDLPYSPHTTIVHSSKSNEKDEEEIKCCDVLYKRYNNLYRCNLEEISDPLENNFENINITNPVAKKQNKLDRFDEILAEQICINEKLPENYCKPREDLDVPPPAHGESPWKQNQLDIEKEQKNIAEEHASVLEQYEDDLEKFEDYEEEEEEDDDDDHYLQAQEALLNSYKDKLSKKRDDKKNSHAFNERPPSRRGERPPGRRGERPCDIISERPSSAAGKLEFNLCRNRYRMLNTPMRIGSAITSQSSNDFDSRHQLFHKNSDIPCSTYYEEQTDTSEYYSTLNTVTNFFETRLDLTNNINSKYCTRKPTSISSMSDNLPMPYSLEKIPYLKQHESETQDDISNPSTSTRCNDTFAKEIFPNKVPEENKQEDDF